MKRILALCTSPYQLLVVNQLMDEFFVDDSISIAIADTTANVESLYNRALKEKRYQAVYLWKIKDVVKFGKCEKLKDVISFRIQTDRYTFKLSGLNERYDVFLYANISRITNYIIDRVLRNNPDAKIEMFEDGFSTYSTYTGDYFKQKNLKHWFTRKNIWKTDALYIFNPEIMDWKPGYPVKRVSTEFSCECLNRINRVFSYDVLTDNYENRVVFFEESYSADGKKIDDIELLEECAAVLGKDNIIVKTHPRNPTNRFFERGFITNTNTSIPWEVILINGDFSHSVFITMASNAAMNPFFLFGIRTPVFLLFKCSRTPESMHRDIIDFDEQLCSKYTDIFRIPRNYDEFRKEITLLAGGKE